MDILLTYFVPILAATITMSTPLVFASVGGAFSVRSGVMALGLESMMLTGAFCGVLGSYFSGNAWVGFLCGTLGGMVIGGLHGLLSVRYKVNQVISGIGLNLLATGATTLIMQLLWKSKGASPGVESIDTTLGSTLPFLDSIPVLGPIIGKQSINFVIIILVVVVGWVVLFKTRFGLRLRMVGENPKAASAVGLRVHGTKYVGVLICGALAGYGGAFLSLDQLNLFVRDMTAGRGYIAVVIAILGRYDPIRIVPCALLFGFCDALQIYLQNQAIPTQLIQMLPYVVTLLVLAFGVKHIRPPAGVGKYEDE